MPTIGIDIGGTRLRVGVVSGAKVLWKLVVPTQADRGPDYVLDDTLKLVNQAMAYATAQSLSIEGIGVGCPGPLNPFGGIVLSPPNLPGWQNIHLANIISEFGGGPVHLDNDANVAALGEWLFGAGQGCRNVFYVTISTGIGGGAVAEGKLLRGESGAAAEVGHLCVQAIGGAPCMCGRNGCLEAYASGTGIVSRMRHLLLANPAFPTQCRLDELTPEVIAISARRGDTLASSLLQETSHFLGIGLANIIDLFNPEILILGGGLTALQDELIRPALTVMRNHIFSPWARELAVCEPALGEDAGLVGAAALVNYNRADNAKALYTNAGRVD